jgi:hypothetical protein
MIPIWDLPPSSSSTELMLLLSSDMLKGRELARYHLSYVLVRTPTTNRLYLIRSMYLSYACSICPTIAFRGARLPLIQYIFFLLHLVTSHTWRDRVPPFSLYLFPLPRVSRFSCRDDLRIFFSSLPLKLLQELEYAERKCEASSWGFAFVT